MSTDQALFLTLISGPLASVFLLLGHRIWRSGRIQRFFKYRRVAWGQASREEKIYFALRVFAILWIIWAGLMVMR
jgi:hypothetical protein